MRKVLFIFICMFFVNFSFSQTLTEKYIIDGNERFNKGEYLDAIDYYLRAAVQEKDKESQASGIDGLKKCIEKINPGKNIIVEATKYEQLKKDLESYKKNAIDTDTKEGLEKLRKQILELNTNLGNCEKTNQGLTAKNKELKSENEHLTNELLKCKSKNLNLTGHYVSFGSGSSYGYFGLNYQYRFGDYALSFGGGYPSVIIGNKYYFSDLPDLLNFSDYGKHFENTYALLNLGYNQRKIRNTHYYNYYQPTYDYGCFYMSVLIGYNKQWSIDNISIGFNAGVGFSHYFGSGTSLAYDIGLVLHF